jgi:hypothetical protein
LPWEVSPLFRQWLEAHFPDRAARVMSRVRDMRGGKDYDSTFGRRMHGEGIWADLIRQRFEKTVLRLGLGIRSGRFKGLDSSRFHPPLVAAPVASAIATVATIARAAEGGIAPSKTRNMKAKARKDDSSGQFELF